jgi:hypothetical protein
MFINTPTRRRGCFRISNAARARKLISASPSNPTARFIFGASSTTSPPWTRRRGRFCARCANTRCRPTRQFLKRTWPQIKLATQWLIAKDGNGDGLIEGNQHNTLDTDWFGPVAWLSGLYLAALAAAAEMADEVGDAEFARQCRGILGTGQRTWSRNFSTASISSTRFRSETSRRDQFRHGLRD